MPSVRVKRWIAGVAFALGALSAVDGCASRRDVVRVGAVREEHGGARACGRLGNGKLGKAGAPYAMSSTALAERTRATEALECAARTTRATTPLEPLAAASATTAAEDPATCASTSQCYDGFSPSGDAVADVSLLGDRCGRACGMTALSKTHEVDARDDAAPLVFALDLDDTTCYRVFAVGGEGIRVLRAAIVDESGRAVSIDNSRDRAPMLGPRDPFCPSHSGHFRLVVAAERGAGRYALQVWTKARRSE
jgi:hypothetical protein